MSGPISSSITRLYGTKGWITLGAFALVLFVLIPVANLAIPSESAFHVSTYWVTLAGKIMCYAMVALAMDLMALVVDSVTVNTEGLLHGVPQFRLRNRAVGVRLLRHGDGRDVLDGGVGTTGGTHHGSHCDQPFCLGS